MNLVVISCHTLTLVNVTIGSSLPYYHTTGNCLIL